MPLTQAQECRTQRVHKVQSKKIVAVAIRTKTLRVTQNGRTHVFGLPDSFSVYSSADSGYHLNVKFWAQDHIILQECVYSGNFFMCLASLGGV